MLLAILVGFTVGCSDNQFASDEPIGGADQATNGTAEKLKGASADTDTSNDADSQKDHDSDEDDGNAEGDDGESEEAELFNADTVVGELSGSDDDRAIASCLEQWGRVPFGPDDVTAYRTLRGEVTGFSNREIKDQAETRRPELVLVDFDVVGFSQLSLFLLNPNGWYCIKTSAVGFSGRELTRHCLARIVSDQTDITGFSRSNESVIGSCQRDD